MNAAELPLAGLEFALVGPGRVGTSLALWAVARGARCLSVAGSAGSGHAGELATRLGARVADAGELADTGARLVWIAVPDGRIGEVARRLAGRRRLGVALHVSGALGASVLAPLAASGCRTGSFHPSRAFATVEPSVEAAAGTFFALDGDAEARALGRRLALAFGGDSAVVAEAQRPLYHWAATLAAGGVVTLLATARAAGARLGLPAAALAGYGALARGALDAALAADDPATAITGPAARGEIETVEGHLTALARDAPDLLPLAIELARATLARCAAAGPLDAAQQRLADRLARQDLLDRVKERVLTSTRPMPA
ncbi:MAG: DUF2520 domain-containing protein [Thermoanaerobaculia bacterium]|nr:DUF2520 domain-containing protein [Thermoanaerobaculia bacterium]